MTRNKLGTGGCATCRARRIKCDETRPACENCTLKGTTCAGYAINNQLKFVNAGIKPDRKSQGRQHIHCSAVQSGSKVSERLYRIEDVNDISRRPKKDGRLQKCLVEAKQTGQRQSECIYVLDRPVATLEFPLEGFYTDHFCAFFTRLYQPLAPLHHLSRSDWPITSDRIKFRLKQFKRLNQHSPIQTVVLAIGAATLARTSGIDRNSRVFADSLSFYSTTIKDVRRLLSKKSPDFHDLVSLTFTVLMLGLYEVENGRFDAWLNHVAAAGALLKAIGPEACRGNPKAGSLFLQYWGQSRIPHLLLKIDSPFYQDEWASLLHDDELQYIRAHTYKCIARKDVSGGREVYADLCRLRLKEEASLHSNSVRVLETLVLLTCLSELINQTEINWTAIAVSIMKPPFAAEIDALTDTHHQFFRRFLPLRVVANSDLATKEDRIWCLEQLKELFGHFETDECEPLSEMDVLSLELEWQKIQK